jgi:hypothetical protein
VFLCSQGRCAARLDLLRCANGKSAGSDESRACQSRSAAEHPYPGGCKRYIFPMLAWRRPSRNTLVCRNVQDPCESRAVVPCCLVHAKSCSLFAGRIGWRGGLLATERHRYIHVHCRTYNAVPAATSPINRRPYSRSTIRQAFVWDPAPRQLKLASSR